MGTRFHIEVCPKVPVLSSSASSFAAPAASSQPTLAEIASAVLSGQHLRLAYPIDETAALLGGVSPSFVRDLWYDGKVRGLKIAGKLMIPASEVDRLIRESEQRHRPASAGIGKIAGEHNRKRAAERRRREASHKERVAARKAARTTPTP